MPENKIVTFETIPQLKLGFAGIGLDDINIINKYIDDNTEKLPDLSSQLVGQIKQDEKSKQLEFDLNDTVPKQLRKSGLYIAMLETTILYMSMEL